MERVRVGVVGIGYMGKTHIEGMKAVEEAEVVAVADTGGFKEAAEETAARYGIEAVDSVEKLAERRDIDAVVITTPHALHAEHSIIALENGKHVLLEKPMEISLEKCDRITAAAAERNLKLMIAHSHRYWPGDVVAKRLLEEGKIGQPCMCRDTLATPGFRKGPEDETKRWFYDLDLYGPGGLIAWGIHNIDRFRWWFETEAKVVFSSGHNFRTEIEGDITSNMVSIIFENGVAAQLWYSETLPAPGWKGFMCGAQIAGDEGIMDVDPYNEVKIARDERGEWETVYRVEDFKAERHKTFSSEDRDFIRCIIEDTTPPVTGEDGKAAVAIALAAYESAETGEAVRL